MTTDLTPGPFRTIDQMKAANARLGHHWFTPGAMRFFNSRALSGVYAGRLFVSSEQYRSRHTGYRARLYTIRAVSDAGGVSTVGEFQQYSTRRRAIAAARAMAENILAREVAEMDAAEVAAGAW